MIVIVSSHSGGHLYPGVAVNQLLAKDCLFFIPNREVSKAIAKRYQLKTCYITDSKNPCLWLIGFFKVLFYLLSKRPNSVISTGGFASLATVLAAKLLFISVVLMEQNVVMGKTNRLLARFANQVCLSFKETVNLDIQTKKMRVVGNPIRSQFAALNWEDEFFKQLEALKEKRIIGAIGGSQGAYKLNDWLTKQYDSISEKGWVLVHLVGEAYYKKSGVNEPFVIKKEKNVFILPFLEQMDKLYKLTETWIARAGATSISELRYFKKPALYVPYPYASENHQYKNALWMQEQGFGKLVEEAHLENFNLSVLDEDWAYDAKKALAKDVYEPNDRVLEGFEQIL